MYVIGTHLVLHSILLLLYFLKRDFFNNFNIKAILIKLLFSIDFTGYGLYFLIC